MGMMDNRWANDQEMKRIEKDLQRELADRQARDAAKRAAEAAKGGKK